MYADDFQSNNPFIQDTVLETKYIDPGYLFDRGYTFLDHLLSSSTLYFLNHVLAFLSIFLLSIIIYVTIRMFEIRQKEHKHLLHEIAEYRHLQSLKQKKKEEQGRFKDQRWNSVLSNLFSSNPNDWKASVLEADNMLFDLLTQLGFQGETLGDKLKDANGDSFRMLPSAWEVHTVRNRIAHEGDAFHLSAHEAKRVIALYEAIFQDFGFI